MPQTFSPTPVLSSDPFVVESPGSSPTSQEETVSLLEQVQAALAGFHEQPENPERWAQLLSARRAASEWVAALPRKDTQAMAVHDARLLIRELAQPGADRPIEAADQARVADWAAKSWPGLLATMLLTPAWQLRSAPLLASVPEWLAADYVTWLFAAPQPFLRAGDADTFAQHVRCHLQDLADWVRRNPGSALVRTAAETFLGLDLSRALAVSTHDLKSHAALRGGMAQRLLAKAGDDFLPVESPRIGRRLRVGILAEHFGVSAEMRQLRPLFSLLETERFEVNLFSGRDDFSGIEERAGERPIRYVLPPEHANQLSSLRCAGLDVLVFGCNLAARLEGVARLALHRIARLQVALPLAGHTTGLPMVDLFATGEQAANQWPVQQFTERLGLWRGPVLGVSRELGRQSAGQSWTKESLGFAAGTVVFVSEAAYDLISPETISTWAEVLAQTPGSQLILHPFGGGVVDGQTAARFGASVEAAMRRHGVDTGRLLLSTLDLTNPGDVQALLSVGDVYLEALTANTPEGLLRAFEAGLPVVACDGKTLRSGVAAGWLRSLHLESLVAKDAPGFIAIARRLATDADARMAAAATVNKAMTHLPLFADALAFSDGFGALLEEAFDRLSAEGEKAFAADRTPLRPVALAPVDLTGRWNLGRQLLAEGRAPRAVDFLLAAMACDEGTARLWLDVARALRATGQSAEAIQALETALRLDEKLIDGWVMIAELADIAMIPDLAAEARRIIVALDPSKGSLAQAAITPAAQPKVESIVGKLRSLRVARRGIV